MRSQAGIATILSPLLAAAAVAGCAGALSLPDIENQIEKDLNTRLLGQGAGGFSPRASVTCPKTARLKKGSVFYCDASLTQASGPTPPTPDNPTGIPRVRSERHQIKVTVADPNKVRWELQ